MGMAAIWSNDLNIFVYMISAKTAIERRTFQDFSNMNALGIKCKCCKKVKVNPDSPFVHTC